jgi:low affinity Fe/Cu permease
MEWDSQVCVNFQPASRVAPNLHSRPAAVLLLLLLLLLLLVVVVCRCPSLVSCSLAQCGMLFDFHEDAWQVGISTNITADSIKHIL